MQRWLAWLRHLCPERYSISSLTFCLVESGIGQLEELFA